MRRTGHIEQRVLCTKCPLYRCLDCQVKCKCGNDEWTSHHNRMEFSSPKKEEDKAKDEELNSAYERMQNLIDVVERTDRPPLTTRRGRPLPTGIDYAPQPTSDGTDIFIRGNDRRDDTPTINRDLAEHWRGVAGSTGVISNRSTERPISDNMETGVITAESLHRAVTAMSNRNTPSGQRLGEGQIIPPYVG